MRKLVTCFALTLSLVLVLPAFASKGIWLGLGGDVWNTNSSPYPVSTDSSYIVKWAVTTVAGDGEFNRVSGIALADSGPNSSPYVFGSTGWGGNRAYRRNRGDGSPSDWSAQSGQNDSGGSFLVGVSPDGKYAVHQDVNFGNPVNPNIRGYDAGTDPAGTPLWGIFIQNSFGTPRFGPDNRFYGRGYDPRKLYALDPATGALVWEAPDDVLNSRPGAFYDNGSTVAYIVSGTTTKIAAWDTAASNTTLWSYVDSSTGSAAPTIDPDTGTIYVFRGTRPIALSWTGALLWEGDAIGSSPAESVPECGALSRDGSVYYVQSQTAFTGWTAMGFAGKLYAYDTATGAVNWSYNTETRRYGAPVVSSNGVLFVNNANFAAGAWPGKNLIYAIKDDGASATTLWTFPMAMTNDTSGGWIAIGPGTVYFDGRDLAGQQRCWAITGPNLPLMVETTSLADGKINEAYSFTCVAIGGTPAYTWSATGLPAGLAINSATGEISGTVVVGGTYDFTVTATDSSLAASDDRPLSIAFAGSEILPWATAKTVKVGNAFSETVTTDIDLSPYTWSISAGALPAGITDDGSVTNVLTLSGTPTTVGASNFTLQSTDSVPWIDTENFSITVENMEITGTFPNGGVNFLYSAGLGVDGGFAPYTWSQTGGTLPPPLSLSASTGVISGTPTTAGTYTFSLSVVDSGAPQNTADGEFVIVIKTIPLDIITLSVHNGEPSVLYQTTTWECISSAGGPYTWSQPTGAIPPGLALAQVGDNYELTGTPTTAGYYSFSLQVVNAGETVALAYYIQIEDLSPWQILSNDPCGFPYGDVEGTASYINFDHTGGIVHSNFARKVMNYGLAVGNGKLYAVGGWGTGEYKQWRDDDNNGVPELHNYFDNRQGHNSIYDPATDNWDTAYWRDWGVLSMQPGNPYPINGQPTGYNNFKGTVKPVSISHSEGTSAWNAAFAYDFDLDGTDEIYLYGGYPMGGSSGIYDPDTNSWGESASDGIGGSYITQARKDNIVYICGGTAGHWKFRKYDCLTDTWTIFPDIPAEVYGGASGIIGDKLYVTEGLAGSWNKTYSYDIGTATWDTTTLANMPIGNYRPGSVVHDGKLYVFGGRKFVGNVNGDDIQVYDPASNLWTVLPTKLPETRSRGCARLIGDTVYFVDGQGNGAENNVWSLDLAGVVAPEITDVARNGSGNIEITFTDGGQTCKIESSTDAYDYVESNMTWADEATGLSSGTWEDTSTPGTGEKYYRVVGETTGERADTVGMMVNSIVVGRNMVSSPLEPYPEGGVLALGGQIGESSLDKIIGDQLTGSGISKNFSDTVEKWDNASAVYLRAWYDTANWKDWVIEANPPTFGYDADVGYWINILAFNPAKNLKQFGRVSPGGRSMLIAKGRNLVGSAFPTSRTLSTSNLATSGLTGSAISKFFSDTLEMWNVGASNYDRFWYDTGGGGWTEWNGGALRTIDPGDSIWITVLAFNFSFSWNYPVSGGGN